MIRPTGLVDPEVVVKPTKGQIDDLMHEIKLRTERDERVLVTTLTKKMAEDLTDYLLEHGIRVRYLHSEVDTLRRVELLRELRRGEFDVLVGINLLREGLDLPEVTPGGDPRRRQGGLPALRHEPDPDDRPGRPQRLRPGPHVCRQDDPVDGAARSTRPTGAGPSRWPTTRSGGVDPQPLRKKIADILDDIYREAEDTAGARPRPGGAIIGGGGRQMSRGKAPVPETRSRGKGRGAADRRPARAWPAPSWPR